MFGLLISSLKLPLTLGNKNKLQFCGDNELFTVKWVSFRGAVVCNTGQAPKPKYYTSYQIIEKH